MIDINLVPTALRKKSGHDMAFLVLLDLPPKVFWGIGGVLFGLLLTIHVLLLAAWGMEMIWFGGYKIQWEQLLPDKKNIDGIGNELKDLKKKMNAITDLTSKKVARWSNKLNFVSDALPKGVWLRRMVLDNNVLTMEGSAVSKSHSEIAAVGNFTAGLKNQTAFINDFTSLEVNSIVRGKKGNTEVTDFTITGKLK